ncbi:MAG: hypothetical protein ACOYYS_19755 [Chloroflexota bacterium]
MTSLAFRRQLTVHASTKRSPIVNGQRSEPTAAAGLQDLLVTPLMPASDGTLRRMALETPTRLLEAYTEQHDVRDGDVLVVGNREYPIKAVFTWDWHGEETLHLVVEDLRSR